MTTLEYFIAHAPPVQDWFEPKMEPFKYDKPNVYSWVRVNIGDVDSIPFTEPGGLLILSVVPSHLKESAESFNNDWFRYEKELMKYRCLWAREQQLQWPIAWALQVIKRISGKSESSTPEGFGFGVTRRIIGQSWQPIETAPKETSVLCFEKNTGAIFVAAFEEWFKSRNPEKKHFRWYIKRGTEKAYSGEGVEPESFDLEPTHWQPLPDLPA